jgi:hypothetical protein
MLADAEPPGYRRKPAQDCEARRITQAQANSLSLVQFDTKRYSVPVKYAHRTITMVATFDDVKLVFEDRLIARHRRHWGREQYFFDPIHYPALLERKPGAFDYARPLADWQLPECFNVLRRRMERTPDGLGTKEFIRVLLLLEKASPEELASAVEDAMGLGIADADTIRVIVEHHQEHGAREAPSEGAQAADDVERVREGRLPGGGREPLSPRLPPVALRTGQGAVHRRPGEC